MYIELYDKGMSLNSIAIFKKLPRSRLWLDENGTVASNKASTFSCKI